MKQINDGGPAFPADIQHYDAVRGEWEEAPPQGMSLRDWFAGMAMQGLLANTFAQTTETKAKTFAGSAYEFADAMIKVREVNNEPA